MKIGRLSPENEILSELGRRLAQVRKRQGYTQIQLAAEAGIGVATLRRIEGGDDGQLATWLKLFKALQMTPSIDSLLPENYASPMAEVFAAHKRRRNRPPAGRGVVWGDEPE